MGPSFIITTHWRAEASAARVWPLLAHAAHWPRWWSSISRTDLIPTSGPPDGRPWRLALGRPLQLAVATLASQPHQWLTVRLRGDVQGQATFTLGQDAPNGLDITCRCELQLPAADMPGWALWVQRRIRKLLLTLAQDMGRALECRVHILDSWQGSAWRP
jgi:hypothetical protein